MSAALKRRFNFETVLPIGDIARRDGPGRSARRGGCSTAPAFPRRAPRGPHELLVTTFHELRARQDRGRQGDRAAHHRDEHGRGGLRRLRGGRAGALLRRASTPGAEHVVQHLVGTALKDEPDDLKRLRHYFEHVVRGAPRAAPGRTSTRRALAARVIRWFGGPHHSPAARGSCASWSLRERPAAVLIEGPCGLQRPDRRARARSPAADRDLLVGRAGRAGRAGAYHPFCVYSPEWQALRAGVEIGADVRFIDLPWASIAGARARSPTATPTTSCARSRAMPALCERLGVDDFDAAWDVLVEIDPALGLDEYLRRVRAAVRGAARARCRSVDRASRARSWPEHASREASGRRPGRLRRLPRRRACAQLVDRAPAEMPPAARARRRRAWSRSRPYSFEALDALTGYEAGMPNPGFYDLAWRDDGPGRAPRCCSWWWRCAGAGSTSRPPT